MRKCYCCPRALCRREVLVAKSLQNFCRSIDRRDVGISNMTGTTIRFCRPTPNSPISNSKHHTNTSKISLSDKSNTSQPYGTGLVAQTYQARVHFHVFAPPVSHSKSHSPPSAARVSNRYAPQTMHFSAAPGSTVLGPRVVARAKY